MKAIDVIKAIPEILAFIKIMASPILVGMIVSFFIINTANPEYAELLAISTMMLSIYLGFKWANWARKKHGTTNYMATVDASPDLNSIKK
jgi:hypothetical protein